MRTGPANLITDVAGIAVGNAISVRVRTGVTVLTAGRRGMVAACDVRGGAPGTRETDCLRPGNLVGRAHAVVLSGGSVYGLAAASTVTIALARRDIGVRLTRNVPTVPIVPSAVIFDLANGGDKQWDIEPPYSRLGAEALAAAGRKFGIGAEGAGLGATTGVGPGGLGSASFRFDGVTVGAIVVANPVGSPYLPDSRAFWAWPLEIDGEFGGVRPDVTAIAPAVDPMGADTKLAARARPSLNTMIGVVATDSDLDCAECERLARAAQDGFTRAVRPSHTLMDGDTIFALASGKKPLGRARAAQLARIGSAAADCVARAVARGIHVATKDWRENRAQLGKEGWMS